MTLVPVEFARDLAQSMRAEKITRRLYRLFPPDSIFTPAKDFFPQTHRPEDVDMSAVCTCHIENRSDVKKTPRHECAVDKHRQFEASGEIHGLHFKPADPARQKAMYRADALAVLEEYVWA